MTTAQTLEIYKILNRYFKSEDDAARVVQDIQEIIDTKFEDKKNGLATKEDIVQLEKDIFTSKSEILLKVESKINDSLKWTMGTIIAVGGLVIAIIKLL